MELMEPNTPRHLHHEGSVYVDGKLCTELLLLVRADEFADLLIS
jgi:hypothetical protein